MDKILVYGSDKFVNNVQSENNGQQIISFFEPNAFYNALYAFDNQDIEVIIDENSIADKKGVFSFLGFNKKKLLKQDIEKHPVLSKLLGNAPSEVIEEPEEEVEDIDIPSVDDLPPIEEPPVEDEDFDLEALIAGGVNNLPAEEPVADDEDFDLEALIAGGVDSLPAEEPSDDGMDEDFDLETLIANAEAGNLPDSPLEEESDLESDLQSEIEESLLTEEIPPSINEIDNMEEMIQEEEFVEQKTNELTDTIAMNAMQQMPMQQMPMMNFDNQELKDIIKSTIKDTLDENKSQNIYADLSTLNALISNMLNNKDIHIKVSLREESNTQIVNTNPNMVEKQYDLEKITDTVPGVSPTNPTEINFIDPLSEQGKGVQAVSSKKKEEEKEEDYDINLTSVNNKTTNGSDDMMDFDLEALKMLEEQQKQEEFFSKMGNKKAPNTKKRAKPDLPNQTEQKRKKPEPPKTKQPPEDLVDVQQANLDELSDDELFALLMK